MQVRLEPAELAYLFHTLEVESVFGVDNARLFPADDGVRAELLRNGFAALQEHGWLIPEGRKLRTNTHVVLMAAVMAQPNQVVILSRYTPTGDKQIVAYYLAQTPEISQIAVEQFLTTEQDFLLTQLDDPSIIVQRLCEALQIPEDYSLWQVPITVGIESFRRALQPEMASDSRFSEEASYGEQAPATAAVLASLCNSRPIGDIEIISRNGPQPYTWRDIVILRADDTIYAMTKEPTTSVVELTPLVQGNLTRLLWPEKELVS